MNAIVTQSELITTSFEQLDHFYNKPFQTLWTYMNPKPRPTFNTTLLNSIMELEKLVEINNGYWLHNDSLEKIDYLVFASHAENAFNYGGDLAHFRECIRAQDKQTLKYYAELCINSLYRRLQHYHTDVTTLALIQGPALGGGFESALCADVIIAEKSATLGFPEIIFNLFPGMGAISILERKVGMRLAHELVYSGEMYSASKLHELGVVDVLAEDGCGEEQLYAWIRANHKRRNGFNAIQRAKAAAHPITFESLTAITDIWVDAALRLTERDLKTMDRLIRAQNRKTADSQEHQQKSLAA